MLDQWTFGLVTCNRLINDDVHWSLQVQRSYLPDFPSGTFVLDADFEEINVHFTLPMFLHDLNVQVAAI